MFAIDLDTVFLASHAALHLIESGGSIVNAASISGMAADYGFTAMTAVIVPNPVPAIDCVRHR